MYFSRTGNSTDLLLFILYCLIWMAGGWLIITHLFSLRRNERLITGIAAGWLLDIALSNIFAQILPASFAFWSAAALILFAGLLAVYFSPKRPRFPWEDFRHWENLVWLGGLTLLFELIGRGLAIFDDYVHVPLASIVGAGDIPPHFYADPSIYFAYHYGLHVFAGALERIGGLFPWSAWDLSKAFAIALTFVLGWVWMRRVTHSRVAATLGSLLVGFAGGSRWLLLLLPGRLLDQISSHTEMIGTAQATAPTLAEALISPWKLTGGPPVDLPFAFHSGVFVPAHFILGSNGCLPFVAVITLLILVRRRVTATMIPVIALILAVLALSGEHLFAFLWAGILICLVIALIKGAWQDLEQRTLVLGWGAVLALGAALSLVQGGFITDAARSILASLSGAASIQTNNFYGFALRWPPAVTDAHLAPLSLLDPYQLIVALTELGPALLLLPAITIFSLRRIRKGDWISAGLGIAALLCFIFSIFFVYGLERSETRLIATSLWIWVLLGCPILWQAIRKGGKLERGGLAAGYGVMMLGGVVVFAITLTAIPVSQATYFIHSSDAEVARKYWDQLPQGSQVFDPDPERAVSIFGRASRARPWIYTTYPDWDALVKNPDPIAIARAGYDYLYFDGSWRNSLTPSQQAAFQQPCLILLDSRGHSPETDRWLYDIRECR